MTMNCDSSELLTLGYDLDKWNGYGIKTPIDIDLFKCTNSHAIVCGMSGSGKSYLEHQLISRLALAERQHRGEYYFADYKADDTFSYLKGCERFCTYDDTLKLIDLVHSRLIARQSGLESCKTPVTLILDEYMALVLNLMSVDKKRAIEVTGKISQTLLIGRSLSVRIWIFCQRPDALAFPAGSRLNFGIVCVLGGAARSIYEMLIPDFIDKVKDRQFDRGEGVVLLQGADLRFIKVPTVRNEERIRQTILNALCRHEAVAGGDAQREPTDTAPPTGGRLD